MSNEPTPLKGFISYSRDDIKMRRNFTKHLSSLENMGQLFSWHDGEILAGQEWEPEITRNLETADVILLLVSSSFIASKYCYGIELTKALERHKSHEAIVIPIIIKDCLWESLAFAKLQCLPLKDGRPKSIATWPNKDTAWTEVVKGIKNTISKNQTQTEKKTLEQNPFNLSPLALDIAEWLYKNDPEGMTYLSHNLTRIIEAFSLSQLEVEDAVKELDDYGLVKYKKSYQHQGSVFVQGGLPLAIPDKLDYNIYEDMLTIARVVVKNERIDNQRLQEATQFEIPRLNWAVSALKYKELANVINPMGNHPFAFYQIHSIRETRKFVKDNEQIVIPQTKSKVVPLIESTPTNTESIQKKVRPTKQIADLYEQLQQCFNKEDWEESIKLGEQILELNPNHVDAIQKTSTAYRRRGVDYQSKGDHAKAIEDFTVAIEIWDEDGSTYYYRAMSYKRLGDMTNYCKDIKKAATAKLQPIAVLEELPNCR